MNLFSKKMVFAFSFSLTYSLFSFAAGDSYTDVFPAGFLSKYVLQPDGQILNVGDKSIVQEVFNNSKIDGSLEWSVKSIECPQNKAFKCVGIYTQKDSKIVGSKMNPLASALSNSGFTMLKINPENGEQNSVVKCTSKFTQNTTRDEAKIANCVEYSKANCQKWVDFVSQNRAEVSKVIEQVEECTAVMKSVDKINVNLRNIFQGEIKQSEKDISLAYDNAAHPDRWVGVGTKTEFTQDKLSPHVSSYMDMFTRSKDCNNFAELFVKKFPGTAPYRQVSSETGSGSRQGGKTPKGSGKR